MRGTQRNDPLQGKPEGQWVTFSINIKRGEMVTKQDNKNPEAKELTSRNNTKI
jgi:hypothetical protein